MDNTQKVYAAKKAIVEQLHAEFVEHMKPFAYLLSTDKGIDKHVDIEMEWEQKNNWKQVNDELRKAEQEMVDWALGIIRLHPAYMSALDEIMPRAKRNMTYWHKLVGICFSFSGN